MFWPSEIMLLKKFRRSEPRKLLALLRSSEQKKRRMTREPGAYVSAHRDLLAELKKRYPEEDFSWMVNLAPQDEEESEEEAEGERGNEQNVDQAGGDPPAE